MSTSITTRINDRHHSRRLRAPLTSAAVTAVVGACAFLLGLGVLGCGASPEAPSDATPVTVARGSRSAPAPPPPRAVGSVVDPTGSFGHDRFLATTRALASAVRRVPRPLMRDGDPGQRAVALHVRSVVLGAYSPTGELAAGTIHAIPGIEPLKADANGDFTAGAVDQGEQQTAAAAALRQAKTDATTLADEIDQITVSRTKCSDIFGGISAAAESLTGEDRWLLVVSDLLQSCRRRNVAGSLAGVQVVVVHLCRDARVCAAQRHEFEERLGAMGATDPRFMRFEQFQEALRTVLEGRE